MKEDIMKAMSQVTQTKKFKSIQDKLILAGAIIIVFIIIFTSLMPHKKKVKVLEDAHAERSNNQTLSQNMDYINQLNQKKDKVVLDGHHPPKLRPSKDYIDKELLARMNAPSTFFTAEESHTNSSKEKAHATLVGHDDNSQFLNAQTDIASVSAKKLPHPQFTVPAGEMIPATLETAINSELAGMTRAIITRDIYSLEGNRKLIDKGATIIGQFNADIHQGQNRIFVVWNRVQMTNGVVVTLNSPSTDTIGRAGSAADYIDRHFFERFGSGALLSVLGAYAAVGGIHGNDEYNSSSQYRMNIANSFGQAANQTLARDMQQGPTLQINQGTQINVFVAHDLDFFPVFRGRA